MDKKELLKKCKFYKGEGSPSVGSDHNEKMLAFYERAWVLSDGVVSADCIAEYKNVGLESFSKNDGVPLSLKALLFNRYAHTAWSLASAVEPFKSFYLKYYCS